MGRDKTGFPTYDGDGTTEAIWYMGNDSPSKPDVKKLSALEKIAGGTYLLVFCSAMVAGIGYGIYTAFFD